MKNEKGAGASKKTPLVHRHGERPEVPAVPVVVASKVKNITLRGEDQDRIATLIRAAGVSTEQEAIRHALALACEHYAPAAKAGS